MIMSTMAITIMTTHMITIMRTIMNIVTLMGIPMTMTTTTNRGPSLKWSATSCSTMP